MEELIKGIDYLTNDFLADARRSANGNKSAGVRARKASLELEKLLKEYRKFSLEMAKKNEC